MTTRAGARARHPSREGLLLVTAAIDAHHSGHPDAAAILADLDVALRRDRIGAVAYDLLRENDEAHADDDGYIGCAYFWAYEYRHSMRDATYAERRAVHAAMRASGLSLDGRSRKHARIIDRLASEKNL